jgi:valyl-tRNA synthetase
MMMFGEWLMNEEPFRVVYLSGLIRDPYGKKMGKTKGNVIDPLEVIDEIGSDALRFALVNGAAPGSDLRLTRSRLDGARNFANKLWNAARFVLGAKPAELPADVALSLPESDRLGPAEHWILSRCHVALRDADEAYADYQFAEASRILHAAIWSEYCDWYLEMAKVRLAPEAPPEVRAATWQVLAWVLDRYLRMLHPVMPHITEEIWGRLPHRPDDGDMLITASWPVGTKHKSEADEEQAAAVADILELVSQMRNARADAGIEPSAWLEAELRFEQTDRVKVFAAISDAVARLAHVRPTVVSKDAPAADESSLVVVSPGGAEARLSVSAEDRARDRARLEKELAETEKLLAGTRAKLANDSFVSKAPAAVVDGVRAKEGELAELAERLRTNLSG